MSGLYPSIIFHFTSKEGLFGILEENFKLSYALECVEDPSENTVFGVPMVSFCDLRLSELRQHMAHYNKYGIGLTKEWANWQGLNPVLYVSKNSDFTRGFMAAVKEIYPQPETHNDVNELHRAQRVYMSVLNAYRFMKNYEGRLVRRNREIIENYRFADEREWRYVPALDDYLRGSSKTRQTFPSEIYFETTRKMAVNPASRFRIEDSGNGILAGKNAGKNVGMKVIGVPESSFSPAADKLQTSELLLSS